MAGQTRIDGNLIDTGTDPNDIVSISTGDARYPRLSEDNTLAGNLTVDGQVRSDTVTDSAGTGAPAFPNGAALTDPEITGGIYLGGTGSANYLEDYETGTWTPTLVNLDTSESVNPGGDYRKIGDIVYLRLTFSRAGSWSLGTGLNRISGLPFGGEYKGLHPAFFNNSSGLPLKSALLVVASNASSSFSGEIHFRLDSALSTIRIAHFSFVGRIS